MCTSGTASSPSANSAPDYIALTRNYSIDNKYLDAVNYHLAHLWFTEFRKTFEKSIKDRAKPYINALKFKDKLMFKTLFAAFAVLGKRGNKLWQKFKEIVLK